MPWRLFPWTRAAHDENEEAARQADRAQSVMAVLNERLRETRDRMRAVKERAEQLGTADNGHWPEHP